MRHEFLLLKDMQKKKDAQKICNLLQNSPKTQNWNKRS